MGVVNAMLNHRKPYAVLVRGAEYIGVTYGNVLDYFGFNEGYAKFEFDDGHKTYLITVQELAEGGLLDEGGPIGLACDA